MRQKFCHSFLIAGFLALLFVSANAQATAENGQSAPSLSIKKLDGTTFDLSALKGKVVLVHFWATWCASCKEEMPVLDSYYRQHHGQGIEMIAISADTARHRDDVTTAMKNFGFAGALLSDADSNGFGRPTAIPVTFIIDKSGVVRGKLEPDETMLSDKALDAAIQPLLGR